jgi:transcriptional regulator with XRE-family HTH domain
MPLHDAVKFVIEYGEYETQAAAAEKFGIGKAYLGRLLSGEKENPSEAVLDAMGIVRHAHVEYTIARPTRQPA